MDDKYRKSWHFFSNRKGVLWIFCLMIWLACCGLEPTPETGSGMESSSGKMSESFTENVSEDTGTEVPGNTGGVHREDGRIIIALIDTGVSTTAIDPARLLPGYNYVLGSEDTEDRINHGTAVASRIAGCESASVEALADFAYLVPMVITDKVEGDLRRVDVETLGQAVRDAIDVYRADIINLSLGVRTDAAALEAAVAYAEAQGVLVISAVGNDGADGEPYYPAAYETVLAVGSCDKNGEESYFSQPGADVLAPGEGVLLASRKGAPYGIKGTSFATGVVSAYAARLLQENPEFSARELREKLIEEAVNQGGCLLGRKEK